MLAEMETDVTTDNRTVMVTGAAGNVGRAVADAFAEHGAGLCS